MYTIAATPLNHPDLTALIAELDAYQQTLYPAESNHLIDLSALPAESVIALIIRDTRQQAVGCGAIVLGEEGFGSTPLLRYIRAMGIRPAAPSRRISRIR